MNVHAVLRVWTDCQTSGDCEMYEMLKLNSPLGCVQTDNLSALWTDQACCCGPRTMRSICGWKIVISFLIASKY